MGVGSDSYRSSSSSSEEDEDGGDPQSQCDDHPDVEQKSTSKKKSRGRGGGWSSGSGNGMGRGRPPKFRVRVSDGQPSARRGRAPGRKRYRKRVSDDEEEEVMPQRKRRGLLAEENFPKKEISELELESDGEDEPLAKQEEEMPKNVITDEEAGEVAAEKVVVEGFDEEERTAGKKKRRVEVEKTEKGVKFIKKEIAEQSDELSAKVKSGEVNDETEKGVVAADKRTERFHQKERSARKKRPQVKVETADKAGELGNENFTKEETAEKSDEEDELKTKKKKKRVEVEWLENVTIKSEEDEEAEGLVWEKERMAGKKKQLAEVEKMGMDSRKRGTDDEDEDNLEDKNPAGALNNVGHSKSSRRPNRKKSEGEVPPRPLRGQRGKEQQLDKEIRRKKSKAGNVMADEALEETEQDAEMEVTKFYY